MKYEILHQLGYRFKWNIDSLVTDHVGDGIIIAPRFMNKKFVEDISSQIKSSSIFDPQFFIPDYPKGSLESYDFFPDRIANGFETSEYDESCANESAIRCLNFQIQNNFERIIIPTRYYGGMPTDFIENQEKLFVRPFIDNIRKDIPGKRYFLQLLLNDNMLKDRIFSSEILNWITSLEEISGIYLIVENNPRPSKQLKDIDFLYYMLKFIDNIRRNSMDVIIGYLNTEALLYTIADPTAVAIGTYETTRMFNIRNFQETEDEDKMGPNPRFYVTKLLQWIESNYIGAIIRGLSNQSNFFDINRYQIQMFKTEYKWHFTKPEIYKHQLLEFSNQLKTVAQFDGQERYNTVRSMIESGINWYSQLKNSGIVFDSNSDGSHLYSWLTAANQFAKEKNWI